MKIFLALALSVLPLMAEAAPLPRAPGSLQIPFSVTDHNTARTLWQCDASLLAAYRASGLPSGDSLSTIRSIDRFVRTRIRYREDRGADAWSNFAAAALGGKRSTGDCEDYAMTAVTLALCAGVPEEKLGVALSNQGRGAPDVRKINHAFAYYKDGEKTHAFADTTRRTVAEISPRKDRVAAWQTVPALRHDPRIFVPAIPLPQVGATAGR